MVDPEGLLDVLFGVLVKVLLEPLPDLVSTDVVAVRPTGKLVVVPVSEAEITE